MPNPNVNRRNADDVRNVLANVENLYNQALVSRAFENGSIEASKIAGGTGISRYSGVYVVDANGNGDYTDIATAESDVPAGSILWIFGVQNITATLTVSKNLTLWFSAGGSISSGSFGATVIEVASGVECSLVGSLRGGFLFGIFPSTAVINVLGTGILRLHGMWVDGGGGGAGVNFASTSGSLVMTNCNIKSTATGLNVPGALAAGTYVDYNRIAGSTNAVNSAVAWSNAPFYWNTFDGTLSGLTPNAGTARGNNVEI